MNRASSASRASANSYYAQVDAGRALRAAEQVNETNSRISASRAAQGRMDAARGFSGHVAANITAAHIPPKDRRKYNAAYREEEERTDTLDKINDNNVVRWLQEEEELQKALLLEERRRKLDIKAKDLIQKHKERQPVTTEEDFNQIHDTQGSKTGIRNRLRNAMKFDDSDLQGGYAKLTKVGLLTRIMNIKKKAKAAKPTVRKAAKPVKKPVARKPTKPLLRKAAKPVKPVRRKPTIVRRK